MKRLTLSLIAATLLTLGIAAQEMFTSKFGNVKGVTSVFISKSLLNMMPDVKSNGMDFASVASKAGQHSDT